MRKVPVVLSICIILGYGCAISAENEHKADTEKTTYLSAKSRAVNEHLFIGPQPQLADFENLKSRGIRRVVNFRTPGEMKKLPFREAQALAELGIDYVEIPVGGGQYAYSPAQLSALTNVLQNEKKTLLHCASGQRASVITVAYLITEHGMPVDEAVRHAKGWWPLALEDVLGQELLLSIKLQDK